LQVGLGNVTDESKTTMFTSPTFTGNTSASNVSITGTLQVTSNTLVTNLNADLLDGQHGSFYTANSVFADHTANVSNPHIVTASQVGLGAVTNESKATMFTSPTFTGATTSANTFTSTVATGSAPLVVSSTTLVTNLNADLLDGQHGSFYTANSVFASHTSNVSNPHTVTTTQLNLQNVTNESKATLFTSPTFTGVTTTANTFTSTVATGNAPFVVTSNTVVPNLNADFLDGQHGTYYTANATFATVHSNLYTHTGNTANPHGTTKLQVGLENVTDESKATMFTSPTLTGTVSASNVSITGTLQVTSNALVANLNSDLLDGQHGSYYTANSIFGTLSSNFTTHTSNVANPHATTKLQVGLGNVTDESKATMFTSPTFTGTVSGVSATMVGLGNVTNESKATMFTSPTFTGTVSGVSATMVGLGNVTNESKATMFTSPTFTGTASANNINASGDLTVTGNFVVNGNTFTANTITSLVRDKNLEIGVVAGASDITADGGGITLKGTTDKTITWDQANSNWTSSQSWNLVTGLVYKINNVSVLSSTTLGSSVLDSSLTSVGTLGGLTVTNPIVGSVTGTANTITGVYVGTLTSGQVTTALTFTPYNATNPASYINATASISGSAGSVAGTNVTGTTLASNIVNSSLTGVGTLTSGTINWSTNITTLGIGYFGSPSTIPLTNPVIVATANTNSFAQVQVQNKSTGTSASSDWIASADNGTDTANYLDLGINNSGYTSGTWTLSGANDGYLYVDGGILSIGTATAGKSVSVHTGGTLLTNIVTKFNAVGTASANTTTGAVVVTGGLGVSGTVYANNATFVNIPTAPTAPTSTSNTQIATTAFVQTIRDIIVGDALAFAVALG
jgi:hypothetical protein